MRAFLSILGAAAVFAAAASAQEPPAQPGGGLGAGELRLTLKLNERSVSFRSTLEPLARRTMAFESQEYAPTDSMRAAAAELAPIVAAARAGSAFVIMAYAADPVVAYRRARAVRGELIERHQIAAARLVAAGRAAPGHDGGQTIVDIHEIDPAKCTGCGPTPFRAIAYDSGTMRLVSVLPEKLAPAAEAAAAEEGKAEPRVEAKPAQPKVRVIPLTPGRTAAADEPQPRRAAPVPQARAAAAPVASDCQRPRIIIDDYYPGGPIVPCGAAWRGGAR